MNELTPPVAAAIVKVVTDLLADVYAHIDNDRLDVANDADKLREEMQRQQEFWKLDADLWREQAKNRLADMGKVHDQLAETLEDYSEEVLALQEQNAQLIDDYAKATAQRLKPCGGYKKGGTHYEGDVVLRDGAAWWCVVERTDVDPRDSAGQWRLLSMRGERGAKGDRGAKGETGTPGRDGKDGTGILDARVVDMNLALALSDGTAVHVPLNGLEDAIKAVVKAELRSALKSKQGA